MIHRRFCGAKSGIDFIEEAVLGVVGIDGEWEEEEWMVGPDTTMRVRQLGGSGVDDYLSDCSIRAEVAVDVFFCLPLDLRRVREFDVPFATMSNFHAEFLRISFR